MHGGGTYKFADETEYSGGWVNGLREGQGETNYPDGSRYVGEWKGGYFHGYGELTYSNGTTYKVPPDSRDTLTTLFIFGARKHVGASHLGFLYPASYWWPWRHILLPHLPVDLT